LLACLLVLSTKFNYSFFLSFFLLLLLKGGSKLGNKNETKSVLSLFAQNE